jgi:hypothetical protein
MIAFLVRASLICLLLNLRRVLRFICEVVLIIDPALKDESPATIQSYTDTVVKLKQIIQHYNILKYHISVRIGISRGGR